MGQFFSRITSGCARFHDHDRHYYHCHCYQHHCHIIGVIITHIITTVVTVFITTARHGVGGLTLSMSE